jgi:hypothetical protein
MSAPRFHVTVTVPGTSLRITMKTGITLGETAEATAEELGQWIAAKTMPGILANLKNHDLKALRRQWSAYYQKIMESPSMAPPEPNELAWLKDHLWERRKRQEPPMPIPDSDEWNRFCAQWQEGDEVWGYSYDGGPLAQRAGLAIVRDGEPIAEFVEIQS